MSTINLALGLLPLADHWHHGDWGDGWWIAMLVGMVVVWAFVIAAAIWLIRSFSTRRGDDAAASRESPLQILDRRFAEGGLDVEEYRRRRSVLERED